MRVWAHEQGQPQKRTDSGFAGPGKSSGPAHRKRTLSGTHPVPRDQAAHRGSPSVAENGNAELTTAAPFRLESEFSRVPVNSLAAGSLQAMLAAGRPGNDHEQAADRVAERVMRATEPQFQRRRARPGTRAGGQEKLDRAGQGPAGPSVAPPVVREALRSPGEQLDPATRVFMESRFGCDFSQVRVHSDPVARQSARAVNAHAYTVGHDIVFGDGGFRPATPEGGRLLAHELTHVVQQSAGAPPFQRAPAKGAPPPASPMSQAEAEAWYQEMNVDEAFADPSPWAEGDPVLSDQALEESIQESLQQTLVPEEMHRQLLLRRAQSLGATAYQAADPQGTLAGMQQKITGLKAKIAARKARIAELKKLGPSSKGEIGAIRTEISAFEDEVSALDKARQRLPKSSRFARLGRGAPAGTGKITYAGIQVETAEGKRIALEWAETTGAAHAEEAMIESIESKLTKAQLAGARVTVVGDQVVCGERCVPALTRFAERNGIESVDSFVFQRRQLRPPPAGFIGPQDLASPRTTLRSMTQSATTGQELIKREIPIYRRPPAGSGGPGGPVAAGAESGVEHAVAPAAPGLAATASAEEKLAAGIERAAAEESPSFWSAMASNLANGLKTMTPAKAARMGKNVVAEGVKGYVTAKAVDWIIGESRLEEDLAALDAANHKPHDSTAEKVRGYEKEALGFLPPLVAVPVAAFIRMYPLNPDFLYEATLQENQRKWEKFKEDYGDSESTAQLYNQMLKHEDDVFMGIEPY